jgi:hypothetical protein
MKKKQDSKSYLDSKSTIFKVINSFRLCDRVCIVSALTLQHATSFRQTNKEIVAPKDGIALMLMARFKRGKTNVGYLSIDKRHGRT